ncbi:hypothetical protein FN976_15615 [Caenimonas sedimenti]|uniref:Uncharacterized protein n=1 Tax=Caenimonas sedimenti TaxID=2596921 RepID=A0A562ZPR6_9BURK|nr:hypothetical protein [Caenimonas sedimenti]TWO70407.1 hypothetical protein FN976_15615 [Caenimonas sedimenti]
MPYPYFVALVNAPALTSTARVEAEGRYAKSLESAFGGPDGVAAAFKAWSAALDTAPEDLDADTMALAARWHRVADQARQEGMRGLGEAPGAHFEVRLPISGILLANSPGTAANALRPSA